MMRITIHHILFLICALIVITFYKPVQSKNNGISVVAISIDTVLPQDKMAIFNNIGWGAAFWNLGGLSSAQKTFFAAMEHATGVQRDVYKAYDPEDGSVLPLGMRLWMEGSISSKNLLGQALNGFDSFAFKNGGSKDFTINIAKAIFTPTSLAATLKPHNDIRKLLKKLKHKNKHLRVILVANFDIDTYKALVKLGGDYTKILEMFDATYISGDIHLIFQNPEAWKVVLSQENIAPQDLLVVNCDTTVIDAARQLGAHGFVMKKNDTTALKKQFEKRHLL